MKPLVWMAALAAAVALAGCGGGGGGSSDNGGGTGTQLTGTLLTDTGAAAVGVQVAVVKQDRSVVVGTSNASGFISIDIPSNAIGFVVNARPTSGSSYYPIYTYLGKTYQLTISSNADYASVPQNFIMPMPSSNDISGVTFYGTASPPPPPSGTSYIWPTSSN